MSKKKQEIPHPIDVLVGRNIKEFRGDNGKSQKTLGDEIGLTFQQIQKYESGRNRVSASTLFEISKALRTPIQWFFNNTGRIFPSSSSLEQTDLMLADSAEATKYVADDKTMLHLFMQIREPKVKEAVLVVLKTLAES